MATALDQEKGVEGGINRILEIPALVSELERRVPTFKLDLIQAYLRRVHFFVYYGGDEFSDEGDLLFGQVRQQALSQLLGVTIFESTLCIFGFHIQVVYKRQEAYKAAPKGEEATEGKSMEPKVI